MDSSPAPDAVPVASSSSTATVAEELAGDVAAMTLEERFATLRGIGEECIQEDELMRLLQNKPVPICYDGFEPSGRMHIAQGIVKTINVNKMIRAGCKVKIWIADWFAQLNNKMGGDLKKIQTVGRYMIEIWKAAGMNLDGVEFLWSSEEINKRANEYWPLVMDIAEKNNFKRVTRCCQIMGRTDQEELTAAQIFYPCMQCADIFFLKADICQLGMDQRKVNMLAREYCDDIKRKNKPIILSHHMLPGFKEGQEKMSKSDPSSAIFMEDDEAQVNMKIKQAFCPPKIVEGNPCLEYIKHIVFPWFEKFEVVRKESNGGNKTFANMDELVADYESGALHPADVKPALAKAINEILQPVRDHFNSNNEAKVLLNTVKITVAEELAGGVVVMTLEERFATLQGIGKESIQEDELMRLLQNKPVPICYNSIEPSSCMHIAQNTVAEELAGGVAAMTLEERFAMLRGIGEECIQEDELMRLLQNKLVPICYDGFEPSGRMHIAQGIVKTINVNKMVRAGCKVKIWIADWFAQLNNKMGGDLKKIQTVGHYMIEIWKAAGMNLDGVEFLWTSEEINKRANEYWPLVMDIARKNSIKRITRCCQIMGRTDQEELTAAQIFYPCMQCADIFFLKADICQLGMDQRKVNMLAREYCDGIKRKNKPIVLSHHMLPGFKEGQEKMSKSDPSSAIFMEDDEAQVNVKIKQAFCPPKIVEGNPCLEYIKHIVFPWFGKFEVVRKESNGGNKTFANMDELVADYESGALHPADVKPALAKAINEILQPVHDHFNSNNEAKVLLNTVKKYRVTR